MSRASYQFLLRKFTFKSFFYRNSRVCGTCYTHCLIYISTSGKRVTDRTAEAGSCTTKWLDFSRMVMCLILEVDQPFFFLAVYVYRNYDTASIDLIGFFLIRKFAFCFEFLHCHKSKIHQADKFVFAAFVKFFSVSKIFIIGIYDRCLVITFVEFYVCQFCGECCVTAVVGPVGIQYTDLCHGWITFLFSVEIMLDMLEILECHGQI